MKMRKIVAVTLAMACLFTGCSRKSRVEVKDPSVKNIIESAEDYLDAETWSEKEVIRFLEADQGGVIDGAVIYTNEMIDIMVENGRFLNADIVKKYATVHDIEAFDDGDYIWIELKIIQYNDSADAEDIFGKSFQASGLKEIVSDDTTKMYEEGLGNCIQFQFLLDDDIVVTGLVQLRNDNHSDEMNEEYENAVDFFDSIGIVNPLDYIS